MKFLTIFVCSFIVSVHLFAQASPSKFDGSNENLDFESYPKALKDFVADKKAISKIRSVEQYLSTVGNLFELGEVNRVTASKIVLHPASATFFHLKVIDSVQPQELRLALFLGIVKYVKTFTTDWPNTKQLLYDTYVKYFDLKRKQNVVRLLAQQYSIPGVGNGIPSAETEPSAPGLAWDFQYEMRSPDYAMDYVFCYLIKNADDFPSFLKTVDDLAGSVDLLVPHDSDLEGSIDSQPLPSRLLFLSQGLKTGLIDRCAFKKEKFDSSLIYDVYSKQNINTQYLLFKQDGRLLIQLDPERFSSYVRSLIESPYPEEEETSVGQAFWSELESISQSSSRSMDALHTKYFKEIDAIVKIAFPDFSQTKVLGLVHHMKKLQEFEELGVKLDDPFFQRLKISDLLSVRLFARFLAVYYNSDFETKFPVSSLTKEKIGTLELFFEPQDPNYLTHFIPLVNGFTMPLFDQGLFNWYEAHFLDLYANQARAVIFTEEQYEQIRSDAFQSEGGARKRVLQELLSLLQNGRYDTDRLPGSLRDQLFKRIEVFQQLPDGIEMRNYRGNFDEEYSRAISEKKIKFVFDPDVYSADEVFVYDSYRDYRDCLSLDEYPQAFLTAISLDSHLPDIKSTALYRKNPNALMKKFSELLQKDSNLIFNFLYNIDDVNFENFVPLFIPLQSDLTDTLIDLSARVNDEKLQRLYALVDRFTLPLEEKLFGGLMYNLLQKWSFLESETNMNLLQLLTKKKGNVNLAETFRFESSFEELVRELLDRLDYDSNLIKTFDRWSVDWKKMVELEGDNRSGEEGGRRKAKELKSALIKNRIDFKKNRPLKKIDLTQVSDDTINYYQKRYEETQQ